MSEIKTIDDLVEYCTEMTMDAKRSSIYSDEYEYYSGQGIAYEDMLEKLNELKANMEK